MWPFKKKIPVSEYVAIQMPPPLPKEELSVNTEVELSKVDVTVTFKNGDEVTYFVQEEIGPPNNTYWYPIVKLVHSYYLVQKVKHCFESKEAFHFNQMKEKPSVNFEDAREVVFSQPIPYKSEFVVERVIDGVQWELENLIKEQK